MDKQKFYMQLCYLLLNKFCDNHIEITEEEWNQFDFDKGFTIKHRINPNNNLEVVALLEQN